MNAGELLVLSRELGAIGMTAVRGARLPGGAMPDARSLIAADLLAHAPTSVGEITDRTGLRLGFVADAVTELGEHGIVETQPDPRNSDRTLVRLLAKHPETAVPAASAPVDAALRDALGPGTDPEAADVILSALATLAECLRPNGREPSGRRQQPAPRRRPAEPEKAPRTRMAAPPSGVTRYDATRVDLGATRPDATRVDRPRAGADRSRAARPGPGRIRTDSLRVSRLARRRKGWRGLIP